MRLSRTVALLACVVSAGSAIAQNAAAWPSRPVTIITGYQPGSGVDTVARFIAEQMRKRTGQPFIVETKPGAIGNVAASAVARSAPDGYSVLFTPNSTHAINPHLFKQLPYDPVRDFLPVTTVLSVGFMLLVNPQSVPVNSVSELTEYVRARPGKISYGSGNASVEVAAAMYQRLAKLDAVNVRYKGVPQSLTDLLGGQVHFIFSDVSFGLPMTRAGKVKALAVTTARRVSAMPGVPTMVEAGIAGFEEVNGWMALFYPANVPLEIAQKFADQANQFMAGDEARELLSRLGSDPFPGSPAESTKFIANELAKWGRIVRAAGIQAE